MEKTARERERERGREREKEGVCEGGVRRGVVKEGRGWRRKAERG